ncbi:hypothetical protein [uncultured Lacinutrix sp.]|uniref:hypothetical protein n=1 Tax=uncultured Lacinutrix sp. TaxID=574032 RepID=UPI00262D0552|nr:hypothetical protein [uncultured Lacinutrix sp.]
MKRYQRKRIIVCFNGVLPHGGLVDRLKGIVSYYEIAKCLDYDFYIQFDDPFSLDVFLESNVLDWKIKRKEVQYHPTKTKIIYTVNNFNINPLDSIKKSNAETFLIYANIDYLKILHPNEASAFLEEKWKTNFNELFKKSKLLESKLKGIEKDKYICFHTRFTTLMGDFVDTTSLILNNTEKDKLINQLQKEIQVITESSNHKCYAFSDSIHFLNTIKAKEDINLVKGNPFHMDNFKNDDNLEGHLKTVLDFFMISESEKVYFLKIGKMYHSSFSKYAAIIGGKPFEIITD